MHCSMTMTYRVYNATVQLFISIMLMLDKEKGIFKKLHPDWQNQHHAILH